MNEYIKHGFIRNINRSEDKHRLELLNIEIIHCCLDHPDPKKRGSYETIKKALQKKDIS